MSSHKFLPLHFSKNQTSIVAVSDSESMIFLQWVWLVSDSIGATPNRAPSLKFFGLARLQLAGLSKLFLGKGSLLSMVLLAGTM